MGFEDLMRRAVGSSDLEPNEINAFVQEMNIIKQGINKLGSIVDDSKETLSYNVFNNANFGILPHESASLYMSGNTQTVTSAYVPITNWDPTSNNGASWEKGLRVDSTLGRIYVDGITRETVIFVQMSGYFTGTSDIPSDGAARLAYRADDGSIRDVYVPSGGAGTSWFNRSAFLTHVRSLPAGQTYYEMQVIQSSGVTESTFHNGLFTITRLR